MSWCDFSDVPEWRYRPSSLWDSDYEHESRLAWHRGYHWRHYPASMRQSDYDLMQRFWRDHPHPTRYFSDLSVA